MACGPGLRYARGEAGRWRALAFQVFVKDPSMLNGCVVRSTERLHLVLRGASASVMHCSGVHWDGCCRT